MEHAKSGAPGSDADGGSADGAFLTADIGGTNARFALVQPSGAIVQQQTYAVADFSTLEHALNEFLGTVPHRPLAAALAVAGPVSPDGKASLTNAHWRFDGAELAEKYDLSVCRVVNDFVAVSRFALMAGPSDTMPLKPGTPLDGAPILTIGPGTGLGQGLVVPTGEKAVTVSTEGGHGILPGANQEERDVLRGLEADLGRVATIEDVLSGDGLVRLHRVMSGETSDAPAITAAALDEDGAARRTVHQFCAFFGSVAGGAALSTGARGGVVVAGGILPRIRSLLSATPWEERFIGTGRMTEYVSQIPVKLIIASDGSLRGGAGLLSDVIG